MRADIHDGPEHMPGHGRYAAAVLLGLQEVPVIQVEGLSEAKRRALALAENKIAENAGWDRELLATELPELADILIVEGLDLSITGFAPVEIDQIATDFEDDPSDPADTVDPEWIKGPPLSTRGDLWQLGHHRLFQRPGSHATETGLHAKRSEKNWDGITLWSTRL
jgi:ParB-like chromosome segregation protein Spo0J